MVLNNLEPSQNCYDLIAKFEGMALKAYLCPSGVWTIGYGHTAGVKKGMTITKTEAEKLLKSDVKVFSAAVNRLVKVELNQNQFDALVSFTFNVGIGNLQGSTLLRVLNKGSYNEVPEQMKRWKYGSNRKLLNGLVRRRDEESKLWLKRSN